MIEQLDLFASSVIEEKSDEEQREEFNTLYDTNLTTRQWKTYNLIRDNSLLGRVTTPREIVDNYSCNMYKDGYVWTDNPRNHSHCSTIWQDVNDINSEWNIAKILIWDEDYNYKFAETPEEVKEFCNRIYWKKAMSKLWRHGNLTRKVRRDGQCRFLFDDKSKAREYWQAFFNEHLEDMVNMSMEESTHEESDIE